MKPTRSYINGAAVLLLVISIWLIFSLAITRCSSRESDSRPSAAPDVSVETLRPDTTEIQTTKKKKEKKKSKSDLKGKVYPDRDPLSEHVW